MKCTHTLLDTSSSGTEKCPCCHRSNNETHLFLCPDCSDPEITFQSKREFESTFRFGRETALDVLTSTLRDGESPQDHLTTCPDSNCKRDILRSLEVLGL